MFTTITRNIVQLIGMRCFTDCENGNVCLLLVVLWAFFLLARNPTKIIKLHLDGFKREINRDQ
jgi:hypothetical protein